MRLLIKVCGMRQAENIKQVEALGIDYMGFIFFDKSPRNVTAVPAHLPAHCKRVGVFVNANISHIAAVVQEFHLQAVQLHGDESPQFCAQVRSLGVEVIKAFAVSVADDLAQIPAYETACHFALLDAKTASRGGSGNRFNWDVLNAYCSTLPFFLSGGIGAEMAAEIKKISHPQLVGIDLNSRFELEPALKDISLLKPFIKEIKNEKY